MYVMTVFVFSGSSRPLFYLVFFFFEFLPAFAPFLHTFYSMHMLYAIVCHLPHPLDRISIFAEPKPPPKHPAIQLSTHRGRSTPCGEHCLSRNTPPSTHCHCRTDSSSARSRYDAGIRGSGASILWCRLSLQSSALRFAVRFAQGERSTANTGLVDACSMPAFARHFLSCTVVRGPWPAPRPILLG